MQREIIKRGKYHFHRITDGVYLTYDMSSKEKQMKGIVFTTDARGRKWNAVDNSGKMNTKDFRTMSAAAETM